MVGACAKEFTDRLCECNPDNLHPRLYAKKEDFVRMRNLVRTDSQYEEWYRTFKMIADYSLPLPPFEWELRDNLRLLHISQDETSRLNALALAYQIEQDERYAKRVYEELEHINTFKDWNPNHYLDVAQMTYAVSLAYDWCYEAFSENQRNMITDMVRKCCLAPYKEVYQNYASGKEFRPGKDLGSWSITPGNWNYWCNGAAIAAAIVFGDEEPEICGFMAQEAMKSLEHALYSYAPDGGFVEGVTYGMAANSYWALFASALLTALETDYGAVDTPGLADFAYFVLYMTGTVTGFNFHDAGDNAKHCYSNGFFVGNQKNESFLGEMRRRALVNHETHASIYDLIWYKPIEQGKSDNKLPLDRYFRKVESGSFRSSWEDPDAIWLAFHGGENDVAHTHMDSGTFVLDAFGVNWACDLGTESLTYFGTREQMGPNHFLLYRMAPDGHNTIVVDPSDTEEGQAIPSFCPVTEFESRECGGFAIMDLTPAYTRQEEGNVWDMHSKRVGIPRNYYRTRVHSARRGFALTDDRRRVIIQDEIDPVQPCEIWWSMHTPAKIEISGDGKTAILSRFGKYLKAQLLTPDHPDSVFLAMKAEPLPGALQNKYQEINKGIQKLAVCIKTAEKVRISVQFTDLDNTDSGASVQLDDWKKLLLESSHREK